MENKTKYKSTEAELRAVPLPVETDTYKPISHGDLIDLVEEGIKNAGLLVAYRQYISSKEGDVATATYAIENVADDEMMLMIGWQNSYNKSVTLKFAIGAHIFICSNGALVSDFGAFKRKHTGDVQTIAPATITEYIKTAQEVFVKLQKDREMMKTIQVSKRRAAELIGRMVIEEKIITPTQMNIIVRQLNKPSYDYGASGSLWELYQFTTYALRSDHPSTWVQSHIQAHEFFLDELGEQTLRPTLVLSKDNVDPQEKNQMTIFDVEGVSEDFHIPQTVEEVIAFEKEHPEEVELPEKLKTFSTTTIDTTIDPDSNYLVKIVSLDDENTEREYPYKVLADDDENAERIARSIFEFDFPMRPIEYLTINKIR